MSTPNTKKSFLSLALWEGAGVRAFTLVELIVVITILVILGTIAFVSLAGYSGSARDSSRISDMANISKGLDIAYAKTSTYPMPDSYFTVTYSGGTVWYQGEVGTTVMNILTSAGAKLSKQPPLDPLVTTAKYTYSKVAYAKDSYQLKANWEGDKIAYNYNPRNLTFSTSSPALLLAGEGSKNILPLLLGEDRGEVKELPFISQAQAASGNPTVAYIAGNYNGVVAKTQTGTMTYILAVPSIISNTGSIGLILAIDSAQKSLSGALLTNGGSNTTGVTYNPVVAYASGSLPSTTSEKTALATGIATAYSGSSLVSSSNIKPYITAYAANDTTTLASLGGNILNSLGGNASTTSLSVASSVQPYSSGTTYLPPQQFSYDGAMVTVTGTGIGSSSTRADPICNTNDIVIWSGSNLQIWAACNAGANTLYNPITHGWSGTLISASEPARMLAYSGVINSATNFLGNYYQWGRNDPVSLLATGAIFHSGAYQTGGVLLSSASGFIISGGTTYGTWVTDAGHESSNNVVWSNVNNSGPCPVGYHIPTGGTVDATTEWGKAYIIMNSQSFVGSCNQAIALDRLRCILALPLIGYRTYTGGQFMQQGFRGMYCSSSPYPALDKVRGTDFSIASSNITDAQGYGYAYPVRCIRN